MTERLPGIDVQSLERVMVDCVVLFGVHLVFFFSPGFRFIIELNLHLLLLSI